MADSSQERRATFMRCCRRPCCWIRWGLACFRWACWRLWVDLGRKGIDRGAFLGVECNRFLVSNGISGIFSFILSFGESINQLINQCLSNPRHAPFEQLLDNKNKNENSTSDNYNVSYCCTTKGICKMGVVYRIPLIETPALPLADVILALFFISTSTSTSTSNSNIGGTSPQPRTPYLPPSYFFLREEGRGFVSGGGGGGGGGEV